MQETIQSVLKSLRDLTIASIRWMELLLSKATTGFAKISKSLATELMNITQKLYSELSPILASIPSKVAAFGTALNAKANSVPIIAQTIAFFNKLNAQIGSYVARTPWLNRMMQQIPPLNPVLAGVLKALLIVSILPPVIALTAGAAMFIYAWPMKMITMSVGNIRNFGSDFGKSVRQSTNVTRENLSDIWADKENNFVTKIVRSIPDIVQLVASPLLALGKSTISLILNTVTLPIASFAAALNTGVDTTKAVLKVSFKKMQEPLKNDSDSGKPIIERSKVLSFGSTNQATSQNDDADDVPAPRKTSRPKCAIQ